MPSSVCTLTYARPGVDRVGRPTSADAGEPADEVRGREGARGEDAVMAAAAERHVTPGVVDGASQTTIGPVGAPSYGCRRPECGCGP